MKQKNKIWELYSSNILSTIEEIIHSSQVDIIKDTSFSHSYAKIKQFEEAIMK